MPRSFFIALACLLILASPAFAETDGEVYEEVDKIIGEAEEGVRGNLATFIQANERPLGKARNELAELIARLNKDGRSQLATSIQKRVNTLEDTVQKRASAKVPIIEPPKKPLLERLEGKWQNPNDKHWVRTIDREGRYTETAGGNSHHGQLKVIGPDSAEVVSSSGWRMVLHASGQDVIAMMVWNAQGRLDGDGRILLRVE